MTLTENLTIKILSVAEIVNDWLCS